MKYRLILPFGLMLMLGLQTASDELEVPLKYKRLTSGLLFQVMRDQLEGQFQLDGKTYSISLQGTQRGGGWLDGLFGNPPETPPVIRVDRLWLSWGTDESCSSSMPAGLYLHGKLYDVRVDVQNNKLTLSSIQEGLAEVSLPAGTEHLLLTHTEGEPHFFVLEPGGNMRIPDGEYRLEHYALFRKDDKGDLWTISSWVEGPGVRVQTDKPAGLRFGAPLEARVHIDDSQIGRVRRGWSRKVNLEFILTGQAGEEVSIPRRVEKDSRTQRPAPPSYRITTADGELVAQGKFEYG